MTLFNLSSILLVDDDEISNLFNKIFLGKLNLDVELDIALNGKEALNFLGVKDGDTGEESIPLPCLLLLDIKMPQMDGWSFLKEYEQNVSKAIRDQIVIVMLTTSEDEGDKVKALKNPNVKRFIQKPLSEEKFRDIISGYFAEVEA